MSVSVISSAMTMRFVPLSIISSRQSIFDDELFDTMIGVLFSL